MSFTPANTADSAMNSASKASAIRRARVVLPTPGGPHRIIECGLPASSARRSGFPGPSRCRCPTTSSSDFGRIASARGGTGARAGKRSDIPALLHVADHVRPLGRREAEQPRAQLRIALERPEAEHCRLPEAVDELHCLQPGWTESHADPREVAFPVARQGLEPVD